jgi:hypothetical protein
VPWGSGTTGGDPRPVVPAPGRAAW